MKTLLLTSVLFLSGGLLVACGQESTGSAEVNENSGEMTEVAIGVNSEMNLEIWEDVSSRLEEKENITLDVVLFGSYVQNNRALHDGELAANAFQYFPTTYNYNKENDADIVPIGYTFIAPMGIYGSDAVDSLEEIPEGGTVAIPNDPDSGEHALSVLELVDLIEVEDTGSDSATVEDITENPLNLEFVEVEASQLPRTLGDSDIAVMGSTHASDGGLSQEDALYIQTPEETPEKYVLTFAVKEENADSEVLHTILDEYQTEETAEFSEEVSDGAYVPAWSEDDTTLEDFEEFVEEQEAGE